MSVPAGSGLHHRPALRKPPQHSKHSLRDDSLECRVVGRNSFLLHDGGGYFGRSERPWSYPQGVLRKPGQFIVGKVARAPVRPLRRDCIGVRAGRKEADRGV